MRTTLLTVALALVAATTMLAQIPRTINYQGRIKSTGLENGDSTMTLRIWDSETGGTELFEETHKVAFRDGVFTVAIGGSTPGGLPAGITFDRQLWLGVTISGVNGGNELTPRFILRSSPYSLRSVIADSSARTALATRATGADAADSAAVADSAHAVFAPLEIATSKGSTKPTLHVTGSGYAIVSTGVDSTSEHYVSGKNAGSTSSPTPGSIFRDNIPMAWAQISRDGSLVTDYGVTSVTYNAAVGYYEITLDQLLDTVRIPGQEFLIPAVAPTISLGGLNAEAGQDAQPAYTVWSFKRSASGQGYEGNVIQVRIFSGAGQPTQRPFSITVMGRPR